MLLPEGRPANPTIDEVTHITGLKSRDGEYKNMLGKAMSFGLVMEGSTCKHRPWELRGTWWLRPSE